MGRRAIKNFEELALTPLRLDALSLAEVGYAAIDTGAALARTLRLEDQTLYIGDTAHSLEGRRVLFVGVGKCALAAARTIEHILGEKLTSGVALDVSNDTHTTLSKIELFVGTHPLPSEVNERATRRIFELLSGCTEQDLVLMLISGGGSTLLCLNQPPMTCNDESKLFTELSAHGATIQELNTVRKHTSLARGGGLAKAAYPAHVVALVVSDVPGNDVSFIASGPTVLDTTTVADAEAILVKYGIDPAPLTLIESPKDPALFERVTTTLFLTNRDALVAMQEEASRRGYGATIIDDRIHGESRIVTKEIMSALHAAPAKSVLLYGGETTVTLGEAHGNGGRNQEMSLAALSYIGEGELLLPCASDGRDNTDHAGAVADTLTCEHAKELRLDPEEYLANHNSYTFFTSTGDALLVGYTESNVSDFIIAIKQ